MTAAAAPARAKAPAWSPAAPAPPLVRRRTAQDFVPPLASLAAIPARPSVQRTCEACAEEETEERRLPVQPRLEVGPVGDRFEVEADSIAAKVMAMRDSDATGADPAVQRACSACASDDEPRARRRRTGGEESDEDEPVRARRVESGDASETIGASHGDLTQGGSPLPPATLDFFEQRMGRDLADVRIHQGGGARDLNQSIGARAFTFQNHIWLGSGETAGPSFTMAHELAHVMQQTAPGPLGAAQPRREALRAEEAEPAIQRKAAPFWLPSNIAAGKPTRAQHTHMHNAALTAIRKQNGRVITEVPIPGGNRDGVGPGVCGFADIYTANGELGTVTVPGVEEVAAPPPASAPPAPDAPADPSTPPPPEGEAPPVARPLPAAATIASLHNFKLSESKTSCKDRIGNAMQQGPGKSSGNIHDSLRAPKIVSGRLTEMASAPTHVRIGEMKPAHDPDYRDSGVDQINNYIAGINNTAAVTNDVAQATGENARWEPGATDIGSTLALPPGWDPDGNIASDYPITSIKIRYYAPTRHRVVPGTGKAKTRKSVRAKDAKQGRPKSQPIRGRWMMTADPQRSGLFVYFLAPEPRDLATAMATPSTRENFRKLAAKIENVQRDLYTSPKPTKIGASVQRRPLDPAAAAGPAAPVLRAPPRVMRSEVKESFNASAWEASRTGSGEDSLISRYEQWAPEELREEVAEQGAMAEWLAVRPDKSLDYPAQPGQEDLRSDLELLRSADFWTGIQARPFGILRQKFGRFFAMAFKKASEFGEQMQAKFKGRTEADMLGKGQPGGTIRKAAAKVAAVVLPRIAKPFLRTMYDTIVDCGVAGFEAKVKSMIQGPAIDTVIDTADQLRDKVDQVADDVEGYFTGVIEKAIGPYENDIRDFVDKAELVGKVAGFIVELAQAARIGACVVSLATAPETVGVGAVIGCGAALGDYILSKFGLSPVEYFIAWTLESCATQNQIGAMIAGLDLFKSLPRRAGQAIVREAKSLLAASTVIPGEFAGKTFGVHASELFCNPDDMPVPDLPYEETDCSDTGFFKTSSTGAYRIPDGPDGVRLFEDGDPVDANEIRWQGVEVPPGASAPTSPPKTVEKAPPSGTPPADSGAPPEKKAEGEVVSDGGSGDSEVELPDTLSQGDLTGSPATVRLFIDAAHLAKKKFDGKEEFPIQLYAFGSQQVIYGPMAIKIRPTGSEVRDGQIIIRFWFIPLTAGNTKDLIFTDSESGLRFTLHESFTKERKGTLLIEPEEGK